MSETTQGSRCRWLRRFLARAILAATGSWYAGTNANAADEPWWAGILTVSSEDEHYTAGPGYEWRQDPDAGHHGPHHLPPVIGSFSRGPGEASLRFPVDRVIVTSLQVPVAGTLTPQPLTANNPVGGSPLTLVPGGGTFNILRGSNLTIFDSASPVTAQQLQTFNRLCTGFQPFTVVGTVGSENVVSTLTTAQIDAAFAATGQPYDLVSIVDPSGNLLNAANGVLAAANAVNGTTIFDPTTSAAIRAKDTETSGVLNGSVNNGDLFDALYAFDYVVDMAVPSPSADGLFGRTTVGTNGVVRTTNRLFFDYSIVNNALPTSRAESIDRFTLAWERTFGEGHFSLEGRINMAAALDNRIILENGAGPSQTEFGNMLLVLKQELYVSDCAVVSGGLGMSLPTGSDVAIDNLAGVPILELDNEAIHFKPFIAGILGPDDHWFFQGFFEYDVAGGTNNALLNLTGQGLRKVGRYRDSSHLLFDLQAGYWFGESHDDHGHGGGHGGHDDHGGGHDDHGGGHDDHGGHGGHDDHEEEPFWMPQRWAPIVELHFDRGMSDASVLRGPSYRITDISSDREAVNMLFGSIFDMGHDKTVSVAYVTGVGGDGSSSDGEFRMVLNWPFNPR